MPDIVMDPEVFGLTGVPVNLEFPAVVAAAPAGAVVAILTVHTGAPPLDNDFPGFDYLVMINLSNHVVQLPQLGTGAPGYLQNRLVGGFVNDPAFGGAGPTTLAQLGAHQVYATTIPVGTINFNVAFVGPAD